jgi:hypothetical protein
VSIDLWFEADARLSEDALVPLLRGAGAVQFELENGVIGFTFPFGLGAFPCRAEGAPRLKAEDPRGLAFTVASRCVFRPSEEYDWSMNDLRQFLEVVVKETSAHFVVSFQLEQTLFLHAGGGLKCL